MNRHVRLLGLIVLFLALGLVGGILFDRIVLFAVLPPGGIPVAATSEFRLMGEAWNTIHRVYVDQTALDSQNLTYGAIGGMVDALGDTGHSRLLTPQMVQQKII